MKRFVGVAVAAAVLGCGVAACKKAHDAGNDSMDIGGARIVAEGHVRAPTAGPSSAGTIGVRPSGAAR